MTSRTAIMRQLLARLLPLERVGPTLRRAARQAVAAEDPERMRRVAAAIVAELQRRGDLVRVAVEGGAPDAGPLVVLRGQTTLIDLSPLQGTEGTPAAALPAPAARAAAAAVTLRAPGSLAASGGAGEPAAATPRGEGARGGSLAEFQRLLQAMQNAQDLQVGGPLSSHRQVILEGILDLLERSLPGLRLAVELNEDVDPQVPSRRVLGQGGAPAWPLWRHLRAHGTSVWIDSVQELPPSLLPAVRLQPPPEAAARSPEFHGAVAVPVLSPPRNESEPPSRGDEAGLLYLVPLEPWPRPLLLSLGRELAVFVTRRWRQHQAMSLLVHCDSLTGAHNRAYFESQFAFELERARRRESPLALVLADIDHFKLVNDRYGHPVGDLVLKAVAQALQGALRRIDVVCRVGGEEFALLLPDTPPDAAHEVGQRLLEQMNRRINLMAHPGVTAPAPLHVTLSFGGVTFPDGGTDAAELYRKADGMLYLSKRQGRNRCTFWNPRGEPLVQTGPAMPPR